MFCANCYNEIPEDKSCYRHQNTNQRFCSQDCLIDWLIYSNAVRLETSEDETEDESNSEE